MTTFDIDNKNPHLTRQSDIINEDVLGMPITIIGAGAIGSFAALTLAKMGFADITVFDDDTIEVENMNCQFFRFSDIGENKVDALKDLVKQFTDIDIETNAFRYEGEEAFKGIVISAVDSMAVRKMIWNAHKGKLQTELFIDPRMGAEYADCYAMDPMEERDQNSYEKTLFSDDDAEPERCTAKSTMYTVLGISAHVAKVVKDFLCTEDKNYTRICQWQIKDNFQHCAPKVRKEEEDAQA